MLNMLIKKPVLLKIAPDLNKIQLDEIVELVAQTKIDGIIATNTSVSRENLKASKETLEKLETADFQGNQSVKKVQKSSDIWLKS